MDDGVSEELAGLLTAERQALLAGDVEAAARLAPRKEQLALALDPADLPASEVEALGRAARRNARLIEAATEGLRAAAARLRALAEPQPPLSVYDGSGRRQELARPPGALTRRA